MNFHFERPKPLSSPQWSTPKKLSKSPIQVISKSQFVQANFKFVVAPWFSSTDPCLYEADEPVPWDNVLAVLLPPLGQPAQDVDSDNELPDEIVPNNKTCPICLDEAQVPKITSCGHVFCYCCVLRHLSNDRSNANKCPVCSTSICHSELKTTFWTGDVGFSNFLRYSSGLHKSVQPVSQPVQIDGDVCFQLLRIERGSVVPFTITSPDALDNRVGMMLPIFDSPQAQFSRLCCFDERTTRLFYMYEKHVLERYRASCLPTDYKNTTGANNASSNKNANDAAGGNSSSWAKALIPQEPAQENTSNYMYLNGDVESLPYIAMAEDWLDAQQKQFDAKMNDVAGRDKWVASGSFTGTGMSAKIPNSHKTATEGASAHVTLPLDPNTTYSFQLVDGQPVYLLPMCVKFLLELYAEEATKPVDPSAEIHSGSTEESASKPASKSSKGGGRAADTAEKYVHLPIMLHGTVVEVERIRITEALRQRYVTLRHLPVFTQIELLEIDLHEMVNAHPNRAHASAVLSKFSDELSRRAARRREKKQKARKELKADNDRRLAEKLQVQEKLDFQRSIKFNEQLQLQELLAFGPSLNINRTESAGAASNSGSRSRPGGSGAASPVPPNQPADPAPVPSASAASHATPLPPSAQLPPAPPVKNSFAEITHMGGNFPTLQQSTNKSAKGAKGGKRDGGGGYATSSDSDVSPRMTTRKSSSAAAAATNVWGVPVVQTTPEAKPKGAIVAPSTPTSTASSTEQQQSTQSNNGKNGKQKGKVVLMSNISLRGTR